MTNQFNVGDKVILDPEGFWSLPSTIKHAKEGTVGTAVRVSGHSVDIDFPGDRTIPGINQSHVFPAPKERDVKAETVEYLKGQKSALESKLSKAYKEVDEASVRAQVLAFQIKEFESMIATLSPEEKPELTPGMRVIIDDPEKGSHGLVARVKKVNGDGTFSTEEMPYAIYKGWKLA